VSIPLHIVSSYQRRSSLPTFSQTHSLLSSESRRSRRVVGRYPHLSLTFPLPRVYSSTDFQAVSRTLFIDGPVFHASRIRTEKRALRERIVKQSRRSTARGVVGSRFFIHVAEETIQNPFSPFLYIFQSRMNIFYIFPRWRSG